ncbi:MAG: amino acid-binding protein [Gammaproteobacteria bacterium RBG_16_57_12]|nr:MAG: amino acid-binding protein [Gammaproteobacteria bacterium RBG_16_57_12]
MNNWYMLTLVGKDRPGIVARISSALYQADCNLGEASMMRLGGNFTIMLMVKFPGSAKALDGVIRTEVESLGLQAHINPIEARLHEHLVPDVRISVYGADRAGIVAQVTGALAEAGLNILDLDSDVGGSADKPIYIMTMEGRAQQGIEALRSALEVISRQGIHTHIEAIDTLIG